MHLVLLATSGNQAYIFSTGKLRENVGASELTLRACTDWAIDAASQLGAGVRIVSASSGSALFLVENPAVGRELVSMVTRRALLDAPGLEVRGVVGEAFDLTANSISEEIERLHRAMEGWDLPSPLERYPRLPFVAECASSGLPATEVSRWGGDQGPRSRVALKKQQARTEEATRKRLLELGVSEELAGSDSSSKRWTAIDELAGDKNWIGVVHVDGNNFGRLFSGLAQFSGAAGGSEEFLAAYSEFSTELDTCVKDAYQTARASVEDQRRSISSTDKSPLLLPLVLGGDDLTVACRGEYAIDFSVAFLQAFELRTSRGICSKVARDLTGVAHLTASAGVAVVHAHFPFVYAYELAEELSRSAKSVKRHVLDAEGASYPCSALDFQILYDSATRSLDDIREGMYADGRDTVLHCRPYVTSSLADVSLAEGAAEWLELHDWSVLAKKRAPLLAKETKAPSSQLHDLRSLLPAGRGVVDARYRLIRDRYVALTGLEIEPDSLFGRSGKLHMTHLLDAMDLDGFASVTTSLGANAHA